ncbi:hypothetical protein KFK09_004174 [Dendrobium nobile]|uniref:Reverse transcriptase zinc-binding domain-containing protein n=1 Tax=Dendrobium nobile TaxID=94219 RepID=A0A8T3C5G1_DENNO|nr:hypothetical protein KFK09_004174 [Dendrobium nobile]
MATSFLFRMLNNNNLIGSWFREKFESPWKNPPPHASKFWKMLCTVAASILPSISLWVHKTCNLSFLWDPWCKKKAAADIHFSNRLSHLRVDSFIVDDKWVLPDVFPPEIYYVISSIDILEEQPVITWEGSPSPPPPNKKIMASFHDNFDDVAWCKFIWHKGHALRYSCYAWMALIGKLKTSDNLITRGIMVAGHCSFCCDHLENHSHIFFECDYTFSILTDLIPVTGMFNLRPNLMQVLNFFDNMHDYSRRDKCFCYLTLATIIYFTWRERNCRIFSNVWNSPGKVKFDIINAVRAKTINWNGIDNLKDKFVNILG